MKDFLLDVGQKILFIIGVVFVVLVVVFGSMKAAPKIASFFEKDADPTTPPTVVAQDTTEATRTEESSIVVNQASQTITSGSPLTITWNDTKADNDGAYYFSYDCNRDLINVSIIDGDYVTDLACHTSYALVDTNGSLQIQAESESATDLAYILIFVPEDSNENMRSTQQTVALLPRETTLAMSDTDSKEETGTPLIIRDEEEDITILGEVDETIETIVEPVESQTLASQDIEVIDSEEDDATETTPVASPVASFTDPEEKEQAETITPDMSTPSDMQVTETIVREETTSTPPPAPQRTAQAAPISQTTLATPIIATPRHPDLSIESVTTRDGFVTFRVYNRGNALASPWTFNYTIPEIVELHTSEVQPALKPGQGVLLTITFNGLDMDRGVTSIVVDPRNNIKESNENNNISLISFDTNN